MPGWFGFRAALIKCTGNIIPCCCEPLFIPFEYPENPVNLAASMDGRSFSNGNAATTNTNSRPLSLRLCVYPLLIGGCSHANYALSSFVYSAATAADIDLIWVNMGVENGC